MASWAKGYDPALLAERMENAKSVSGAGKVSFSGFEHSEHVVVLNSMLVLDPEVPEVEKRRIVNQATFKAGEKGVITPKLLLAEANKLERSYLTSSVNPYRLITTISIARSCQFPAVRFKGSSIVVHAKVSKKVRNSRNDLLQDARRSVNSKLPDHYADVSVSVNARSTAEAADKAMDRLDFVRGVWNLWKNRGHGFRISSGGREPVNDIILGPIHTLHHVNGELATQTWWYEPQYQGPIALFHSKPNAQSMSKYMTSFRGHLDKSKYERDLIQAVVRYVRALDSRDWDDSFLRLWSVLEFLTGTVSDSYKLTIKRASSIFTDREYTHLVLSHLRDFRNKAVHAGSSSGDIEALMYQLKRYIEKLIEFHVGNTYRFVSIADAAEFMDIPNDKELIKEKIRKLSYAQKYKLGP